MTDVTVEGLQETVDKLAKHSVQFYKDADKIVRRYARNVTKDAKAAVPVGETGNLRDAIKAKYFNKNASPAATVYPRGWKGSHRHLVEYGTAPRTQKTTGRFTGRTKAQPFMGPAERQNEPQYLAEMTRLVNQNVSI